MTWILQHASQKRSKYASYSWYLTNILPQTVWFLLAINIFRARVQRMFTVICYHQVNVRNSQFSLKFHLAFKSSLLFWKKIFLFPTQSYIYSCLFIYSTFLLWKLIATKKTSTEISLWWSQRSSSSMIKKRDSEYIRTHALS